MILQVGLGRGGYQGGFRNFQWGGWEGAQTLFLKKSGSTWPKHTVRCPVSSKINGGCPPFFYPRLYYRECRGSYVITGKGCVGLLY